MRRVVAVAALLISLAASAVARADDFDFYVLSLSWSPSWCASEDRDGSTAQCDGRRPYGLIVHGLWPQNERGWPEYCASRESDRVPSSLAARYYDIIPSAGLAGHEWRKHGTCSGLNQARYFETVRAAYNKVRLPPVLFDGKIARNLSVDQIEAAFVRANPGMATAGVAVGCDGGQLSEIRICITKGLGFRDCAEVDRGGCRKRTVNLPAIP